MYANGAISCEAGRKSLSIDVCLYINGANSYTNGIKSQSSNAISFSIGTHSLMNGALVYANGNLMHANNGLAIVNGAHKTAYEIVQNPYLRFVNNNAYKLKPKIYEVVI